jgi:hypothetical protein
MRKEEEGAKEYGIKKKEEGRGSSIDKVWASFLFYSEVRLERMAASNLECSLMPFSKVTFGIDLWSCPIFSNC